MTKLGLLSFFLGVFTLSTTVVSPVDAKLRSRSRRRSLQFCFLGGCETTPAADEEEPLLGEFCVPLFGPCAPGTDDVDYSACVNTTRPLFGPCGILSEVVDGIFGSMDTDGDGLGDEVTVRNPFAGRVNENGVVDTTGVPASWLQIFPVDSLVWDIFGPDEFKFDESIFDSAIEAIFGEESTFGRLVVIPFAVDWEPTFGDGTCPVAPTAANPTPTCMTPLGRDGYYVCRTLYNTYTAAPDAKTICVDWEEQLLVPNDVCGCCGDECPDVVLERECACRCDVEGVDDGFTIAGGFGERCVSKEFGIATIGQFDVDCSSACVVDA